jgi:hypothetical protein
VKVPPAAAAALGGPVTVGTPAQAFPFLTVGDGGAPHCCLLSATEIDVAPGGEVVYVAIAGRHASAHLAARPRATLLAAEGTTLHSLTLEVTAAVDHEGVLAAALVVTEHRADSLGIPLTPLGFVPPPEIAELEHWDRTAAALAAIRAAVRGAVGDHTAEP